MTPAHAHAIASTLLLADSAPRPFARVSDFKALIARELLAAYNQGGLDALARHSRPIEITLSTPPPSSRGCEVAADALGIRCGRPVEWRALVGTQLLSFCDSCKVAIVEMKEAAHLKFERVEPRAGKTLVVYNPPPEDCDEARGEEACPQGAD